MFWDKIITENEPSDPSSVDENEEKEASLERVPCAQDDEEDEYINLCKELGISCGRQELTKFLREQNISVYKIQPVFNYLTSKGNWNVWPLRQKDMLPDTMRLWADVLEWPSVCDSRRVHGSLDGAFRDRMPIPVLMTVKALVQQFGDRVRFYIFTDSMEDPFLAVTLDNCSLTVVERWGEPSFRGAE